MRGREDEKPRGQASASGVFFVLLLLALFVDGGCDRGPNGPVAQLETTVPGVFAVGDVRSGSVKRVGGAIGEGAQVVAALHGFLGDAAKPAL